MNKFLITIFSILSVVVLAACSDDDSFSANTSNKLSFECDTLSFDTLFAEVNSPTSSFWVYNNSSDGIRLSSVRLSGGNQKGFRVNVDGMELNSKNGYIVSDIDIRKGDSIRVFVEALIPKNAKDGFLTTEDKLQFTLQSGVVQDVVLSATSINAISMRNVVVRRDSIITGSKPIIVYGGITVDSAATLTIGQGTTLYFHDGAGIDVYGRLLISGDTSSVVTLRSDRLDKLFPYLPYDHLVGQWRGIHFFSSSYDNEIVNADIHGAVDGIVCDSSDVNRKKLLLENVIVHNCMGYGVKLTSCAAGFYNCQFSNALQNCLAVCGGNILINSCTIAQFYSLNISDYALLFTNKNDNISYPLVRFAMYNSIVTGFKDDEVLGDGDTISAFSYAFDHCLLKTSETKNDSIRNVIFENNDSTIHSEKNFIKISTDSLYYNFRLDSLSRAIRAADPKTSLQYDLNGHRRNIIAPSLGCYEYTDD